MESAMHNDMRDIPQPGDRVLVDHAGKRGAFYAHVEKITRRRLDRTCERPVIYWHLRLDSGKVERWVNVSVTRVRAGSG